MTSIAAAGSHERGVESALARVRRRLVLLDLLRGGVFGFGVAAVLALMMTRVAAMPTVAIVTAVLATVVTLGYAFTRRRSLVDVAQSVEVRTPELRNLLRTSAELLRSSDMASPGMRSLVLMQADDRVAALGNRLLPDTSRAYAHVGGAVLLWLVALWSGTATASRVGDQVLTTVRQTFNPNSIGRVNVRIVPPRYSGASATEIADPERVEALVGSELHISVASELDLVLINGTDTTAMIAQGAVRRATITVERDGFLIVRSREDEGVDRRLIGISAIPDHVPSVRITAPGRDLFILDSTRTIDVAIEATDDIGLTGLRLRYTRVSGSGERFTFTEGEVPVSIDRRGNREWKAKGQLRLPQFTLAQGDMLVYRAVATDARPGAAAVESDAFIVEIIGAGGDAAAGFSIDPEQDRYAVSQQMVVLKTERLIAKRSTMSADSLLNEARELAIEQRRVRAEFVFMMGGELAEEITAENSMGDLDETHEAESESDLSAGRMANRGRAALLSAIRAMSRAATALNVAELDRALTHEKTAVVELEKAFSRTRYLLRAFTEREALDLGRRLTGNLEDARSSQRLPIAGSEDERQARLRSVLQELTAVAASGATDSRLTDAATSLLEIDAGSKELQSVSAQLTRAARLVDNLTERKRLLDSATLVLARSLGASSATPITQLNQGIEARRLQGMLRDLRQGRNR